MQHHNCLGYEAQWELWREKGRERTYERERGGGDGGEGERETSVCLVALLKNLRNYVNISFHGYLVYCFNSRLNEDIIQKRKY